MSINVKVEHMWLQEKCTIETIITFEEFLNANNYKIKKIGVYDNLEDLKKTNMREIMINSAFDKLCPLLLEVDATIENVSFDFRFWLSLTEDSGLLMQKDPPNHERWILSYGISLAALLDNEGKLSLEGFVISMHKLLKPFKTICYSPGFNYEGEEESYSQLLLNYKGDHTYLPTIYFAIIKPEYYGGEERLLEELKKARTRWPGPDKWKKADFLLRREGLSDNDLFIKYNNIM